MDPSLVHFSDQSQRLVHTLTTGHREKRSYKMSRISSVLYLSRKSYTQGKERGTKERTLGNATKTFSHLNTLLTIKVVVWQLSESRKFEIKYV